MSTSVARQSASLRRAAPLLRASALVLPRASAYAFMAKLPAEKREQIKRLLLEGMSPAKVSGEGRNQPWDAERYQQYWAPEIREALDRKMVPRLRAAIGREKHK